MRTSAMATKALEIPLTDLQLGGSLRRTLTCAFGVTLEPEPQLANHPASAIVTIIATAQEILVFIFPFLPRQSHCTLPANFALALIFNACNCLRMTDRKAKRLRWGPSLQLAVQYVLCLEVLMQR
jgi:hypothetical protein